MSDLINQDQAKDIANFFNKKLKKLGLLAMGLTKSVFIESSNYDKFGLPVEQTISVLYIKFKKPEYGNDFLREVMIPLDLSREAIPKHDMLAVRLDINEFHPLFTDRPLVSIYLDNLKKSIKEGFIPHPRP